MGDGGSEGAEVEGFRISAEGESGSFIVDTGLLAAVFAVERDDVVFSVAGVCFAMGGVVKGVGWAARAAACAVEGVTGVEGFSGIADWVGDGAWRMCAGAARGDGVVFAAEGAGAAEVVAGGAVGTMTGCAITA